MSPVINRYLVYLVKSHKSNLNSNCKMWLLVKYVATFSNLIFVAVKMNISKMDKGLFFLQINGFFLKNRITVKEQKGAKKFWFSFFLFFFHYSRICVHIPHSVKRVGGGITRPNVRHTNSLNQPFSLRVCLAQKNAPDFQSHLSTRKEQAFSC